MPPSRTDLLRLESAATNLLTKYKLAVLPTKPGTKQPAISWAAYQDTLPTAHEVAEWFLRRPWDELPGICIVTGGASRCVVLDFDPEPGVDVETLAAAAEKHFSSLLGRPVTFPAGCRVRTCGGGYQDHFTHSVEGNGLASLDKFFYDPALGKIELRARGKIAVMPPTVAYSARTGAIGSYTYVRPLDQRLAWEATWLPEAYLLAAGAAAEPPDAGPKPSPAEIQRVLAEILPDLPAGAAQILNDGHVPVGSRSSRPVKLAYLLAESGITDQRTIATVVLAAPCHKEKFGGRKGGWDAWKDACSIAGKVLAEKRQGSLGSSAAVAAAAAAAEGCGAQPAAGLPPFPESAAVGICADIARMFSSRLEAPFEFWYASALTCLGAAVSGCITLDSVIAPQPRLYTAIIGPTASPRKSTAVNLTARFFEGAVAPLGALHFEHGLGSAEGLAEVLRKDDSQPSRCVILLDELRLLVQKAKIEHSALLPMLCSMYHTNNYNNATRRTRINLRGGHLSLLGACTADTFSSMWTPEFLAIGFINRFFLVPGRASSSIALPDPIPAEERDALAAKLLRLVEDAHKRASITVVVAGKGFPLPDPEPRKLKFTPDALRLWSQWYADRPADAYADRLDDLGLRLVILTEVSRGNLQTVEPDTVQHVVRLLDWQYQVRRAYDPIDAESRMAAMEQRIKRALLTNGSLTTRELRRYTHADRAGLWIFQRALENLTDHGVISKTAKSAKSAIYALLER